MASSQQRRGPTDDTDSVFERSDAESRADNDERSSSKKTVIAKLVSYVQLELDNTGSVARDHLASERTWLAYVRTSLAIASAGVALVQLFAIDSLKDDKKVVNLARPLGAASVLIALFLLGVAFWRYFSIQGALTQGYFVPARIIVFIISILMGGISSIIFAFLVSGMPKR